MEPPTRSVGFKGHEGDGGHGWVGMDVLRKERARAEFNAFAADEVDGLVRVAYLMVGDQPEAQDLVQESCCGSPENGHGFVRCGTAAPTRDGCFST